MDRETMYVYAHAAVGILGGVVCILNQYAGTILVLVSILALYAIKDRLDLSFEERGGFSWYLFNCLLLSLTLWWLIWILLYNIL